MPGDTLPLKVVRQQDRQKLETALNAAPPFTRLIAVVQPCFPCPVNVHTVSLHCTSPWQPLLCTVYLQL